MKYVKFLFLILFIFLIGCGEVPDDNKGNDDKEKEEENIFESLKSEYEIFVGESIDFTSQVKATEFTIESMEENVEINGKTVKGTKAGVTFLLINSLGREISVKVTVNAKDDFTVDDMELYVLEKKEIIVNVIKGDKNNLEYTALTDNIEIVDNNFILAKKVGDAKVKIKMGDVEKEMLINVKELELHVLNTSFNIDLSESLEIELEYPKHIEGDIIYTVFDETVIKVIDNTIYPISEGSSDLKIQIGDNRKLSKTIEVTVTIDPVAIFTKINNEVALMKKDVITYGENPKTRTQNVLGSVSRYMFADLNLINKIIDIYDNPYVGMKATPEIVEALDRKGYPRSGVKLEQLKYITYHDTGNNNPGANALGNSNWMSNPDSVKGSSRSWHYTVDSTQVIQSIPDDEITWQGDSYGAYATSIGIETCVDYGSNLNKTWQRMGKLCAMLISKYNLRVTDIKQHYDWSQKNCPQTLRMNGLYEYAISLVEAELMVRKALNGYKISFESLNPEYVDSTGQIIKIPETEITVSYKVTITKGTSYNETVTLQTKITPLL